MIRAVLGEKHSFDIITLSVVLVGVHFIPDLNTHTGVSFLKKYDQNSLVRVVFSICHYNELPSCVQQKSNVTVTKCH